MMIDYKIRAICEGYVDKYCKEDSPILNVEVRHKGYKEAFVEETAEMTKDELLIECLAYRKFVHSLLKDGTLHARYQTFRKLDEVKRGLSSIVVSCSQEE